MGRPEQIEQAAVIEMARWYLPQYPVLNLLFHCPNGGARTKTEAAILNGQGVNPGVSDLILLAPRRGYTSLVIEMKAPGKLSTTTAAQASFLLRAWSEGAITCSCDSGEVAWKLLHWYVQGSKEYAPWPPDEVLYSQHVWWAGKKEGPPEWSLKLHR